MGLFAKTIIRNKTGNVRKEDDRTKMIEDFFAGQKDVVRYEIADNKDWLVNVDGSIHLHESDLDNGELFFRIGNLTGNLYCHCKHLKQSVIPAELGGEIVFVPNEEEQWKNRQTSADSADYSLGGMEMLTTAPTRAQVINKLEKVFTDYIAGEYDIDFDEIIDRLKEEWDNKDKYNLVVKATRRSNGGPVDCDIKIIGGNNDSPLDLQVIEKTMYLTFMLQEKGIRLDYTTPAFWDTARRIYYQIAGNKDEGNKVKERKVKGKKVMNETSGLMSDEIMKITTINGYRSNIRAQIKKRISNDRIVDEFAVEGYKDKPVFVKRATPEIRKHIKEVFGL